MRIGITLTSSLSVGQEYIDLTRTVATTLAQNNFDIAYGGTEYGMMKELAVSYKQSGGKSLLGVMSRELESVTKGYKAFEQLDETIWVQTIGERIREILNKSDGFIILPGGYGTLEEIGVIVGGKVNKLYDKPIILLNHAGFYDKYIAFLDEMVKKDFSKVNVRDIVFVTDSPAEIIEYFTSYSKAKIPDKFV